MRYILNHTLSYSPDIICFQEVLKDFIDIINDNLILKNDYLVSPFFSDTYGIVSLVKKEYNPQFTFISLPTNMDRELLRISLTKDSKQIVVGNVHLESLASQNIRGEQLQTISRELNCSADLTVLVGDFNFCSESNFRNMPKFPLENNILLSTLPEYQDLWKVNARSSGFTFDSHANAMIIQEERMRYDRILAKLGISLLLLFYIT